MDMSRLFKTKKNFRTEFKRQLRYAIAAAVGFMIVFAWRDAIINATKSLVERLSETTHTAAIELSTATIITVVGVLIVVLSSKLLKE
jgi:uncharacterized protein YacL